MKRFGLVSASVAIFALVAFGGEESALASYEGPYSSYWFPEELKEWSPETDREAPFNRSHIPLAADRVEDSVNPNAQSAAQLVALSALNRHTSGVPSQSGDVFYENTFSYWAYTDLMVYWAGSAGEGIIVPPSGDVIDASHRNGVPIVGNVFFPPRVYGGQMEWLQQMLERDEDGSFPMADQLLRVADYYGFDGWFINQETEGADRALADEMQDFLIYLQENKSEDMHIMWYDSMIDSGAISWQNHLTHRNQMYLQQGETRVADSMFLNFWWRDQARSAQLAQTIDRSPYDLYTGVDVEARGTNTIVPWQGIFPENGAAHTSLGLYRPDWAFASSQTMTDFYQKEQDFWVGRSGNPAKTDGDVSWPGMAHFFTAKSPVTSMPFVTHFNTGSGESFAVEGETVATNEWNNRSIQDILPTWRWIRGGHGALEVDFNWDEAYEGGSSLMLTGSLPKGEKAQVELYETHIPLTEQAMAEWIVKAEDAEVRIGLRLEESEEYIYLDGSTSKAVDGWHTFEKSLNEYKGEVITGLALEVEQGSEDDLNVFIGGMSIIEQQKETVKAPDVTVRPYEQHSEALTLQFQKREDIHSYRVFQKTDDGKRYIGSTVGDILYVDGVNYTQAGNRQSATLLVEAVNHNFTRSELKEVQVQIGSF